MQAAFEKIIEKLEEEKMFYFLTIANTGDEKLDYAYEKVGDALGKAIEIVKQEAEKFGRDTNVGSNGNGVLKFANLLKELCCKKDEDYDNPVISPKYLNDTIENLLLDYNEQYEECYKDCGDCEAYNKEKHHCPKFCKVIKETVKEIEENHNGWISVKERLPEKEGSYLVIGKSGGAVVTRWYEPSKFYPNGHFGGNCSNYIRYWMPRPEPPQPYQQKG